MGYSKLCAKPLRAGRRGFASARTRRNFYPVASLLCFGAPPTSSSLKAYQSLNGPLPPRPRLGWRNFLRRAYKSINVFKNLLLSSVSILLFGEKISLWIVSPSNCVTPLELRPAQCFNSMVDLSKSI